jgi:hypothetical protein
MSSTLKINVTVNVIKALSLTFLIFAFWFIKHVWFASTYIIFSVVFIECYQKLSLICAFSFNTAGYSGEDNFGSLIIPVYGLRSCFPSTLIFIVTSSLRM